MKYRIKCVTFKDGSQEFTAQKRIKFFFWWTLDSDGIADSLHNGYYKCLTRDKALRRIDRNYEYAISGAGVIKSIDFEYIIK